MYQDFVQKYSSNPAAVAYGNWQISQAYQTTGDLNKALEYGDKALAGAPRNLDILVSQASIAQQAKRQYKVDRTMPPRAAKFATRSASKPKPEGVSDEDFNRQVGRRQRARPEQLRFSRVRRLQRDRQRERCQEPDGRDRKVLGGVSRSKFQDQVSSYAMYTLGPGQLNDQARLFAYGEKTLAANPNSLPALLLLAGTYVDSALPGSVGKAISYYMISRLSSGSSR